VVPVEEGELQNIERAVGKRLPRVAVRDFDYSAKPEGQLEVPLAERIAAIRARKADDRVRAKANEARRGGAGASAGAGANRSGSGRPGESKRSGGRSRGGSSSSRGGGGDRGGR
jgi:ATP-dependent RNA helicase RhlE